MEKNVYYLNQNNLHILPKSVSQRKSRSQPRIRILNKSNKKFGKLELKIIKNIYSFMTLIDQIMISKVNKKYRTAQKIMLFDSVQLFLDFTLISKFYKYLLLNAPKLKKLKKLALNQILLDENILNLLKAIPKEKLKKLKFDDCYFTACKKECSDKISEKYASLISEIKSLEYLFLKNIQYFNVNEEVIPNALFREGSNNLRKIKIISCCMINIKEFAENFYKNKFPNLKLIDFSNNNIGVDIYNQTKFKDLFFNDVSKLKHVNLSSNEISNIDSEYLEKTFESKNFVNEKYEILDLTNNAFEKDSVKFRKKTSFKKRFPNLKIKLDVKKNALPRNYGEGHILPCTKSMLDYKKVQNEIPTEEVDVNRTDQFRILKQ